MQAKRKLDQPAPFTIIRALCRAALAQPNEAVAQQVRRLADAYVATGHAAEAKVLNELLEGTTDSAFAPSRMVRSHAAPSAEELSMLSLLLAGPKTWSGW